MFFARLITGRKNVQGCGRVYRLLRLGQSFANPGPTRSETMTRRRCREYPESKYLVPAFSEIYVRRRRSWAIGGFGQNTTLDLPAFVSLITRSTAAGTARREGAEQFLRVDMILIESLERPFL